MVRVIAEDGAQLGEMLPFDAVRMARERGFDLVEVAPMATPPVCRIMEFNKFKYEQERREREAKKKHRFAKLKELKFKPHIEQHDYGVKLNQLKRFLSRGDRGRVTVVFRGRELAHVELGQRVLERLTRDLVSVGKVERTPIREGRFLSMIFCPDHAALKRASKTKAAPRPPSGPPAEAPQATQVIPSPTRSPTQGSENRAG